MAKFQIVILAMCAIAIITEAAVIRIPTEEVETTTVVASTDDMESTTEQQEVVTTTEPELEPLAGALTKDEEASILIIDQTLLDSNPSDLKKSTVESVQVQRSGKLLLLSTAKLGEKPKVVEEAAEESEEVEEAEQTSTDLPNMETTTVAGQVDEDTTTITVQEDGKEKSSEIPTTKLFPINDTLYDNNNKMTSSANGQDTTVIVEEQPLEPKNSNLAAIVFEEAEADYVLVESDLVEEGPYADIDSDLHLQPVVQSVEIVPSSVDDTLLVNYVHSW